jgi:hypothetical protein
MEANLYGRQRLLFVIMLLCAFIALACQLSITAPGSEATESAEATSPVIRPLTEADERLVSDSFLRETDLPAGWFQDYFGVEASDGGITYSKDFRATDKLELMHVVVTHQIVLYENEPEAKEAYGGRWEEWEPSVPRFGPK